MYRRIRVGIELCNQIRRPGIFDHILAGGTGSVPPLSRTVWTAVLHPVIAIATPFPFSYIYDKTVRFSALYWGMEILMTGKAGFSLNNWALY